VFIRPIPLTLSTFPDISVTTFPFVKVRAPLAKVAFTKELPLPLIIISQPPEEPPEVVPLP